MQNLDALLKSTTTPTKEKEAQPAGPSLKCTCDCWMSRKKYCLKSIGIGIVSTFLQQYRYWYWQ